MTLKEKIKILAKAFSERMKRDDLFYDIVSLAAGAGVVWCPPIGAAAMLFKHCQKRGAKKSRRAVYNSFYHLKRHGFIGIEKRDGQMRISFTEKGRECKRLMKLLQRCRSKLVQKWKGKWYIVMFDVKNEYRTIRDALRYFLRKMGFVQMQKSVWIYPHDCRQEVLFLRNFFELKLKQVRLVVTSEIGDDSYFRKRFRI